MNTVDRCDGMDGRVKERIVAKIMALENDRSLYYWLYISIGSGNCSKWIF